MDAYSIIVEIFDLCLNSDWLVHYALSYGSFKLMHYFIGLRRPVLIIILCSRHLRSFLSQYARLFRLGRWSE